MMYPPAALAQDFTSTEKASLTSISCHPSRFVPAVVWLARWKCVWLVKLFHFIPKRKLSYLSSLLLVCSLTSNPVHLSPFG